MIPLTKMCQMTGVNRRILQDYNALGLLKPCRLTPGGYWLYHEEDVSRLNLIQLLRSHGYTRREVLTILGTQEADLEELLERARHALLERRDRLNQLLEHIELLRLQASIRDEVQPPDAP